MLFTMHLTCHVHFLVFFLPCVMCRLPYPKLGVAELDPPSGTNLCKMLSGEDGNNETVTLSCGSGKISKVINRVSGTSIQNGRSM